MTPTILRLRLGTTKKNPLPKTVKLGTPCTRSQFFSWQAKSKGYRSYMGPLSTNIAGHIALYGSHLLHGLVNLWKKTWRSYWRFDCTFGHMESIHECTPQCSSSSRKWAWHEFETCKEYFLDFCRTIFRWNTKADQWSDRNHWHKPDSFPRF